LRTIVPSTRFDRDLKRMVKRGKTLEKLAAIVRKLQADEALEERHRLHSLSGKWLRYMEYHIEPDWLLIHQLTETELRLVRTGSHTDLF